MALTVVVELETCRHLLDGEARLEEKEGDAFHELDAIHLIAEKCLLEPHAPLQQLLVLKEEGHRPNEHVDGALEYLSLSVVADNLLLGCEIMHGLDSLEI